MKHTTITFEVDKTIIEEAKKVYDALGMDLSTALNLYLRQTVIQQKFPCSLESEITQDIKSTYPDGFFSLFGAGKDLGFDDEPTDSYYDCEEIEL